MGFSGMERNHPNVGYNFQFTYQRNYRMTLFNAKVVVLETYPSAIDPLPSSLLSDLLFVSL